MTARPIPFSGEMVRAIQAGRKTQTRRVVKFHQPLQDHRLWPFMFRTSDGGFGWTDAEKPIPAMIERPGKRCPYGEPGDQLWVREAAWISAPHFADDDWRKGDSGCIRDDEGRKRFVSWDADCDEESRDAARSYGVRMRVPRFMPRWASRITLEIAGIRVERLHDITEADARAEGVGSVADFQKLWDRINGKKHPWAENPWLWVISFRRVSE